MGNCKESGRYLAHFKVIAKAWELSEEEQMKLLGLQTIDDLNLCLSGKRRLNRDMRDRVFYMIEIYCDLHSLFPGNYQANNWIRRPNSFKIFQGRSALSCILGGSISLKEVRDYLGSEAH